MGRPFRKPLTAVLIIFALTFLSRLPALLSNHLYLDGDEAIVGLMTLHFSKGIMVPGFFYGQSYGFCFFEALVALPGQWLAPGNIYVFKISILLLFSCGLCFFWFFMKQWLGTQKAWMAVAVLLLVPGWYLWSMKGRGGYVTAFAFFNLFLWLTSFSANSKKWIFPVLIGLVLHILYISQVLWLVGTLPFLYRWFRAGRFRAKLTGVALGGAISMGVWPLVTDMANNNFWVKPALDFSFKNNLAENLVLNFRHGFDGAYYLTDPLLGKGASIWIGWLGWAMLIIFFIAALVQLRTRFSWFLALFILAVAGSLLQVAALGHFAPRYCLPVLQLLVIGMLLVHGPKKWQSPVWLLSAVCLGWGCVSLTRLKPYKLMKDGANFVTEINALKDDLLRQDVHHAYSSDGLLQWQIAFVSNEQIISRWIYPTDRWPPYPLAVDGALKGRENVALIGFYHDYRKDQLMQESRTFGTTGQELFYYWINPPELWLIESGFQLNEF